MNWIFKRHVDRWSYGIRLLEANRQGCMEDAVDREVRRTLFWLRFWRDVDPMLRPFKCVYRLSKLAWEVVDGRYRKSSKKVHGGAAQASGGSAVAAGFTAPGGGAAFIPVTPPAPRAFEDAGVRAGEVTAYRCWLLKDGLLYSCYRPEFVWEPDKVVEGDSLDINEGVHGFKSRFLSYKYGVSYGDSVVVTGAVDLWGDVYEHERGYRASKAYPSSIDDSPDYDAAELRKKYGLNKKRKRKK